MITIMTSFFKNWFNRPLSDENRDKTFLTVIAILIILLLRSCTGCQDYKKTLQFQKTIAANNYSALNGKIQFLKNKNGELVATKTILYTSREQLKTLNNKLYTELEKEKGRVKTIVDIKTAYVPRPVTVPNRVQQYGQGRYGLFFNSTYRDSGIYSELAGVSKFSVDSLNKISPDSTVISKNSVEIDIIYGTRERNGKLEVFAKSVSPYVMFKSIQGAYITDKQSGGLIPPDGPSQRVYNWNFGPQLAYNYIVTERRHAFRVFGNLQYRSGDYTIGAQLGFGYSPGDAAPDLRTGLRVQYNIFKW